MFVCMCVFVCVGEREGRAWICVCVRARGLCNCVFVCVGVAGGQGVELCLCASERFVCVRVCDFRGRNNRLTLEIEFHMRFRLSIKRFKTPFIGTDRARRPPPATRGGTQLSNKSRIPLPSSFFQL